MKKNAFLLFAALDCIAIAVLVFMYQGYVNHQKSAHFCTSCRPDRIYFNDVSYDFEFLRVLSGSPTGYADIQECFITASVITENDDESWYRAWKTTAERLKATGEQFLADGDEISCVECFFRASNYFKSAEFFLHRNKNDERALSMWRESRDLFRKAIALQKPHLVTPISIPYENTTLPGYLCLVDETGKKRPLLIIQTGFDGTAEELYFQGVVLALKRGFNCLIFEGPGQGAPLREQNLFFRPDWEKVITPVVDYAEKLAVVDPNNIALMGISFGGYLVPRAAAFEKRLKAVIANGGIYDFYEGIIGKSPASEREIFEHLDDPSARKQFNKTMYDVMKRDTGIRWAFNDGFWKFNVQTPADYFDEVKKYTLRDVADKISCPILIVDSESEHFFPGQAKKLFDAIKGPKEFMLFTKQEGAQLHCQIGAIMITMERQLNWLRKIVK